MKRTNKKGFTTVELVIVIAVIAILAAVLIPTFANLVNKANQSSDIQAARAMDTALQTESAAKAPTELKEVIEILNEAGFNVDSLQPISKGCTFYWSQALNKILLVKDEEGDVLYPNKIDTVPSGLENLMNGKSYFTADAADKNEINNALSDGQSVKLSADTTVDRDIYVTGKDATLDLNGHTYSTVQGSNGRSGVLYIEKGATLTVENGTLNVRSLQNSGTLIIKSNVVINAMDVTGGGCIRNKNGGEIIIEGGTFNVLNYIKWDETNYGGAACVYNDGGKVTIKGGTFNTVTAAYAISNVNGGTMTIEAGVIVNAHRGALSNVNGTMTVNGGSFTVTADEETGWTAYHEGTGNLIINGGTFNHVISDRVFYDVTNNG